MNTILIIDDEAPVRKMLKKLLEKSGYAVVTADNGNDGIRQFNAHGPDLVITDLLMPEKEGLETIRTLQHLQKDVSIIAISGGGMIDADTYLNLALKLGVAKTFAKPVDNALLLSAVQDLLS